MNDNEILIETKKAIDLWMDKTYDESSFYSHILTIIRDGIGDGAKHKEQMERLLFRVQRLQEDQARYWSGHKSLLPQCKRQEKELVEKVKYLISHGGYSIERFKAKENTVQQTIF